MWNTCGYLDLTFVVAGHESLIGVHNVDLLSAFGLFHRPWPPDHVTLGPGPHSPTPAVFFTQGHSGHSRRYVRLESAESFSPTQRFSLHSGHNRTFTDFLRARAQLGGLVSDLLNHRQGQMELTLSASLKQWEGNTGSVIAITNHNQHGREQRYVQARYVRSNSQPSTLILLT